MWIGPMALLGIGSSLQMNDCCADSKQASSQNLWSVALTTAIASSWEVFHKNPNLSSPKLIALDA